MIIDRWTGVEVKALRVDAYRWTQKKFAERTGFAVNTISNWECRGSAFVLSGEYAEAMDTLLEALDSTRRQRFEHALAAHAAPDTGLPTRAVQAGWGQGTPVEAIAVADRIADGEAESMPISRREFMAAAGVGAAVAAGTPAISINPDTDVDYLDHFRQLKRVLVDQDSLLGPRTVIPIVQQQIQVMSQLRRTAGTDTLGLLRMQTNYAEFAGWLYHDSGDYDAAEYWTDRALQWSIAANDPMMSSYILNRKAHLAGDIGDGSETVALSAAAVRTAPPETPIGALANMRAAHGHALLGDRPATEHAYETALEELDNPDNDPDSPWAGWLKPSYIQVHRARSLNTLGDFHSAASQFDEVLNTLPPQFARDRAVYMLRAAMAYTGAGEVDHAAQLGIQAISVGHASGSGRFAQELQQLDSALAAWDKQRTVAEFRSTIKGLMPVPNKYV
ncbi:helix-turn-helix domain-containing protein [Nocardia pneumoniae]|uniref:helix-turn-helix domain-containing protein n=1 Tax=Nocardia pneumoniae TaxID=228601 RepID=UPI0002D3FBA1|nr:twin-arginine translocation signal domain-containing protein [Nocardia pneumoniae]